MAAASQAVPERGRCSAIEKRANLPRDPACGKRQSLVTTRVVRKLYKQVSHSGMAAASQAVPGEFDSRHLLQLKKSTQSGCFSRCRGNVRLSTLGRRRRKVNAVFGRARALQMHSLISPLRGVINASLNGQLVLLQKGIRRTLRIQSSSYFLRAIISEFIFGGHNVYF